MGASLLLPLAPLGEADEGRLDVVANLLCRLGAVLIQTARPDAELLPVLIGGPAPLVSALLGDAQEAAVPELLRSLVHLLALGRQLGKLTILVLNVCARLRLETAAWALRHLGRLEVAALAALFRQPNLVARFLGLPLGAVIQLRVVDVGDEAEPKVSVGMVEDEAVILAGSRAEATPDYLREQNLALRRPCEDDATHVPIHASRERPDVAHHLEPTGLKRRLDLRPLGSVGEGVLIAAGHACSLELLLKVFRMGAVYAEAKRRAILAKLQPRLDNIRDEHVLVHRLGQLAFVVIPSHRLDARKVRVRWGEHAEVREIARVNQVLRRRRDDEVIEVLAEPARPRRCAQPDERHVLPLRALHPVAVELEPAMRLVNHHHLGFRQASALKRLDAGNLYRLRPVGERVVSLDDANVGDAFAPKGGDRLVDEAQGRNHEDDAVALGGGAFGDGGAYHCLACASGRLNHRPALAREERIAQRLHGFGLVRAENAFHATLLQALLPAIL